MNAYPETPDAWIERQDPDGPPNPDDACPVCDKIDCVCPPETEGGCLCCGFPKPKHHPDCKWFGL